MWVPVQAVCGQTLILPSKSRAKTELQWLIPYIMVRSIYNILILMLGTLSPTGFRA